MPIFVIEIVFEIVIDCRFANFNHDFNHDFLHSGTPLLRYFTSPGRELGQVCVCVYLYVQTIKFDTNNL